MDPATLLNASLSARDATRDPSSTTTTTTAEDIVVTVTTIAYNLVTSSSGLSRNNFTYRPSSSSSSSSIGVDRSNSTRPAIQWRPNWSSARAELKWTWMVHTYGFACVFFMLAFYAFFSVLNLRAQLSTRPYMSSINVFLCVLGSARAVCFLVDPYQSKGVMPATFGSILWDLAFPSLISAFGLIQLAFLQLTRLRLGPAKLRSKTCMSLVITSHFIVTIAINIVCTYRADFKVFHVASQTIFLIWGGFLCVAFLHGGFHTMRLLKHAPNSMFQRSDSSGFENKVMALGVLANCPNLAAMTAAAAAAVPSFLAAPKIRITDENEQTYSYVSDSSMQIASAGNDDGGGGGRKNSTSTSTNSAAKSRSERRRPSTPTPTPCASATGRSGSCVYTVGSSSSSSSNNQTLSQKHDQQSSTSSSSTLTSTSSPNANRIDGSRRCNHPNQDRRKNGGGGGDIGRSRSPRNLARSPRNVSRSSAPGLLGGLGLMSAGDFAGLEHRSSNGALRCSSIGGKPLAAAAANNLEMSNLLPVGRNSTSKDDMAALYGEFKQDVSLMSILNHIAYVNRAADDYSFDAHKMRPKSRKNQVEKVLQGTYASAVLGFLLCVLEAYRIYGPYGLLASATTTTTTTTMTATATVGSATVSKLLVTTDAPGSWRSSGPAPWPWFIFQTICRFVELSMGCFMANITKQPVNRHHYPYAYHMKHRGGGLYF